MKRIGRILIRWVLPLFLAGGSTAATTWPFGVNAAGAPLLTVPLIRMAQPELSPAISLAHSLSYDGQSFVSRWNVSGIQSYVTPLGSKQFRWQPFDGEPVMIKPGVRTRAANREWFLTRKADDLSITSSDGSEEYVYRNCVPIYARVAGRNYQFTRGSHSLSIERVMPAKALIAHVTYNEDGALGTIETAGTSLRFEYDSLLQLRVIHIGGRDQSVKLAYQDRLVIAVETPELNRSFAWAYPRWQEYFHSLSPIPPFVRRDTGYEYAMERSRRDIVVKFRSLAGGALGRWKLDLQKRTLEIVPGVQTAK